MWSIEGTALELTYNYGTESDEAKYHPGNEEKDSFGHVAFNTDDVYAACTRLEKAGVKFKKKPDEGRMKGLQASPAKLQMNVLEEIKFDEEFKCNNKPGKQYLLTR